MLNNIFNDIETMNSNNNENIFDIENDPISVNHGTISVEDLR